MYRCKRCGYPVPKSQVPIVGTCSSNIKFEKIMGWFCPLCKKRNLKYM